MKLTDLLARIYVINLPERRDRRQQIGAELQRHGLAWQQGQVICWPAQRPDHADGFPTVGTRGCFLSHVAALEDATSLNEGYVLVLEDDAVLLPGLAEALPELAQLLADEQPELVYLGHCHVGGGQAPVTTAGFQPSSQPIEGAHAYLVRTTLLPRLLPYLHGCLERPAGHPQGGRLHYDAALTLFRQFNPDCHTWLAYPTLVEQRFSRSDIQPRWWYDRWPLLRTLAALAREFKQHHRHATGN
ncbi:glycosyltransferase family 25 protein [Chitinilyticum piscinae]|uniref:Glycosyltransferase family 25 protein n=1 Tax=Chitinilyticum piscinae TaxID=2866724 RepID=A0A8J7FHV5_9NEIS|nr:glycosyltransferase family 25 protein [Chitinilyticum piscinae]MBE9609550.1 glycosyltransferase family 25 protein [Chitinilyticum piscinae]